MSRAREFADLAGSADAGGLTGRNLLINGAMQVHQRGNQTASHGSNVYFVDRWNQYQNNNQLGANLQQSTVVPSGQGFSNSLLIDCTTADSSVGSTELVLLRQIIEGQNLQQLAYNTSSAKSVTLSFWVRSTKTGTYVCELYNASTGSGLNRTQSHQYTISAADTWEHKTITFSGDTAAIMDNDSNASLYVSWCLQSGSDYSSGGSTNSTWATDTGSGTTNRYGGQVNFFDSTSNNFYLTGTQLEVGKQATPFEHRSFADELTRCQRYYAERKNSSGAAKYYGRTLQAYGAASAFGLIADYPVTMRATPTISQSGVFGAYYANSGNNSMNNSIQNLYATSHSWGTGGWTGNSNFTAGDAVVMYANDGAKLTADAEL